MPHIHFSIVSVYFTRYARLRNAGLLHAALSHFHCFLAIYRKNIMRYIGFSDENLNISHRIVSDGKILYTAIAKNVRYIIIACDMAHMAFKSMP